ncbi:MAG TPA: TonB-dependent receptor [Vicinamibacterales bacterium]|nr:TonB-dependent receptor [Vicinamibacterales bacterium]
MCRAVKCFLWLAALVLLPASAFAQGTLTGTVRDASGAVLPGVTVEAGSPALTEKVRTVVSDGSGQYRIIELPPGTYSLTFTLPGFSTVKRDGIELAGSAVLTIPAEMRVGALEETITVTGETPVVDVQSVRRETVLSGEVIAAVPATRAVGSLLNATPGLTVDNNGLQPTPTMTFFSARGGPTNEGRMTVNGMTVAAAFNGGGVSSYILDSVNVDEVSVTVAGGMGESDIGGPVMNLVPRGGGNRFQGQAFYNNAGDWSRGDNIDAEQEAAGITETPGIINAYDMSVSYGGPIKRDRLWFFGSYRKLNTYTAVEGVVGNANAFNMSRWDWAPDNSITARRAEGRSMYIGRLTAQATPRNRIQFNHEYQLRCEGSPLTLDGEGCNSRGTDWIAGNAGAGASTTSPEAATAYFDFPYYVTQLTWTSPVTNKLLFEAGFTRFSYYHAGGPGQVPPDGILNIGVTELSAVGGRVPRANYQYRAVSQYNDNYGNPNNWRASASYVTGAHNVKVGYQGQFLRADSHIIANPATLSYTFNQGVPQSFGFRMLDWYQSDRTSTAALFVQDTWTRGRLTLQGALRYDRAWSWSPAEGNGTPTTGPTNAAPITFEQTASVDAFNDLTPRFGVAYDVFGNGRTAIKFNMGRYLDAATNDSAYTRNNPATRIARGAAGVVTRNWQDTNNNRVVDCDLLNFGLQTAVDTCAALGGDNLNFGKTGANLDQINQETLRGWGVRENDWQYGVTLQQEIIPRMSIEVGYARRWFSGFTLTDNLNRSPADYDSFVINAPVDSRLPDGGGYPVTMYAVKPAAAAIPASNYVTFESDYGDNRKNYWHGVDVTFNGRLRNSLMFQLGTSTGKAVDDRCSASPNVDSPGPRDMGTSQALNWPAATCLDSDPWETTLRGLAAYTIPKIDVQVSATFRSQQAFEMPTAAATAGGATNGAVWQVPNTCNTPGCLSIFNLLGRLPANALATGTTAIPLLDNEHRLYVGGRRNQVDMRVAKILRFGPTRADVGLDLGNLLNTNYATAYTSTYQFSQGNALQGGTWLNPTAIYTPRFVRLNFTFNF